MHYIGRRLGPGPSPRSPAVMPWCYARERPNHATSPPFLLLSSRPGCRSTAAPGAACSSLRSAVPGTWDFWADEPSGSVACLALIGLGRGRETDCDCRMQAVSGDQMIIGFSSRPAFRPQRTRCMHPRRPKKKKNTSSNTNGGRQGPGPCLWSRVAWEYQIDLDSRWRAAGSTTFPASTLLQSPPSQQPASTLAFFYFFSFF